MFVRLSPERSIAVRAISQVRLLRVDYDEMVAKAAASGGGGGGAAASDGARSPGGSQMLSIRAFHEELHTTFG